ncbi:MAG: amino acid adenylation domain-containing protein [Candidatus Aminicenantes bacterium]|jgi:amino acid adenylation domain-containing protein
MKNSYIALMVEDTSTLLIAVLGILNSGNCIVPISPDIPIERAVFIVNDCQVKVILTDRTNYPRALQVNEFSSCLEQLLCIDDIDFDPIYSNYHQDQPFLSPTGTRDMDMDQPCYVIYTSGSTGNPKGVMITYRNLIPLLLWFHDYFKLGTHTRVLRNLSYAFDFGMFEILTTALAGGVLYFFDKKALKDLNEYVDFIYVHDINTLHTTPSFFTQIMAPNRQLDPLRLIHLGGEQLTGSLVRDINKQVKEHCYIYNGYGPTETTINSAIFSMKSGGDGAVEIPENIPIGTPSANNIIYILDSCMNFQPVGIAGELYIGGSGVARGYLNRPELTAERFCLRRPGGRFLKKLPPWTPRKNFLLITHSPYLPIYQTGDLARWLPKGSIEFLGRIDHQVKIKGYRIELGEIESQLRLYRHIDKAVVVVQKNPLGGHHLCGYFVSKRQVPDSQLKLFLAARLPTYMIPTYLIRLPGLPLTPTGKVDRRALPKPSPGDAEQYAAPLHHQGKKMQELWAEVLGIEKEHLSIHANFFQSGGHSMKAIILINLIEKIFNVKLTIQDIFQFPTIAELSCLVKEKHSVPFIEIQQQPKKEYYELSISQRRLWDLYKQDTSSTAFNISQQQTFRERLDHRVIEKVLKELVHRHESLRTYFKEIDGVPVQLVMPEGKINPEIIDLTHLSQETQQQEKEQISKARYYSSIQLTQPPLYRFILIKLKENEFELLFIIHHITADGWSMNVLAQEFFLLYQGYKNGTPYRPEPLKLQYKDYVCWQKRMLADENKLRPLQEFWKNQLSGTLLKVKLPHDFNKISHDLGQQSAGYRRVIPGNITHTLGTMAGQRGTSLFMVLLSAFHLLLSHLSGQQDIITGIPAANRQHEDLKKTIGFFVDSVIIRSQVNMNESFITLLEKISHNTLQVLEHQAYPIELACELAQVTWQDILSVFFNMTTFGNVNQTDLSNLHSYHIETVQPAKLEFVCYLTEFKNGVEINTHYYKGLFKPSTVEEFMKLYMKILENAARSPHQILKDMLQR